MSSPVGSPSLRRNKHNQQEDHHELGSPSKKRDKERKKRHFPHPPEPRPSLIDELFQSKKDPLNLLQNDMQGKWDLKVWEFSFNGLRNCLQAFRIFKF